MNRFGKSFRLKKTLTWGNTRAKFDSIRFDDVITRAKNDVVFFGSVCNAPVKGSFLSSIREILGAKYRVCWHLLNTFLFFWISAGNGRIWRKSRKEVFWMGKNRQTWLFLLHAHRSSLTISQGFIIFFLIIDMPVMCLSLVTKFVRLKGKELQFFENWWFFLKSYDLAGLTFFTYAVLLRLDHPSFQSLQYAWYAISLRQEAQ